MNVMLSNPACDVRNSPGRKAGDRTAERAICQSIPSLPAWAIKRNGRRAFSRAGFSFAEVMFAVVILGIGFIMVAAIFPVAIQQTQISGEENMAAAAAREAANAIKSAPGTINNPAYVSTYSTTANGNPTPYEAVPYYSMFPPTVPNYVLGNGTGLPGAGTPLASQNVLVSASVVPPPGIVVPILGARWKQLQTNAIINCDPRFAYVSFYQRENSSSSAKLIVLAVAVRNKTIYTQGVDELNANFTATVTTAVSTLPQQAGFTQVVPDVITMGGQYGEGGCVTTPWTAPPNGATPPLWIPNRSYTLGRGIGTSQPPANTTTAVTTFNTFAINPGDCLALTAGTSGLWGTAGATTDPPLSSTPCTLNTATTLQPIVAYARLQATAANPTGTITLYSDNTMQSNSPPMAAPGAFVIIADDFPYDLTNGASGPISQLLPNITETVAGTNAQVSYRVGAMNGRIFRLGSVVGPAAPCGTIYNLDPQYGMLPTPPGAQESPDNLPSIAMNDAATISAPGPYLESPGPPFFRAKVYIVGIGAQNGAYVGNAQDIGCFASYFQVK